MTFTNEQMAKAKQAKSAEELLAMAKESGIEMTADEAAKYFAELHKEGELTDDELAAIAGGGPKDEEEVPAAPESYFYSGCYGKQVNLSDKPICPNDLGLNTCAECEGCNYPSSDNKEYYYCTGSHMRRTFPLQP